MCPHQCHCALLLLVFTEWSELVVRCSSLAATASLHPSSSHSFPVKEVLGLLRYDCSILCARMKACRRASIVTFSNESLEKVSQTVPAFFLQRHQRRSPTLQIFFRGTYSEQTNCSSASCALSDRWSDVFMLASPSSVSSDASLNAFQHDTPRLPFPEKPRVT